MNTNPYALAIPFFLLLISIEYFYAFKKRKSLYYFNDFVNNISAGIVEQLFSTLAKGALIFPYTYLATNYAMFKIDAHATSNWLILWLSVDFCYYWLHRSNHRCNFLWAGHSVHHQSEQYNLSVALRQGIIQSAFGWVFYLPLAILGFPVWMFATVAALNTLYQFWIHTSLIKHMGPFELFFNTPSHHRVHHGTNLQYIDKNYAGSLIIWDKLFGTFTPEEAPVKYGVTEPLDSWNPFYANFKVFYDIKYYGQWLSSSKDKLLALFMPPEWIVTKLGEKRFQQVKQTNRKSNAITASAYLWIQFAIALISMTDFMFHFSYGSTQYYLIACFIAISIYQLGKELSEQETLFSLEILRSLLILPVIFQMNWLYIFILTLMSCSLTIKNDAPITVT